MKIKQVYWRREDKRKRDDNYIIHAPYGCYRCHEPNRWLDKFMVVYSDVTHHEPKYFKTLEQARLYVQRRINSDMKYLIKNFCEV